MMYINVFLVCEIILDNTNLTPGHITAMFVVIGAVLSFLGVYELIANISLVGSSIPITSFGNALYQASLEGFQQNGIIGMFANLLTTTSAGISSAIFFGFVFSCFFRVRD